MNFSEYYEVCLY